MIFSLWVGEKLPNFQKMCLNSFSYYEIDVYLYCYEDIKNLPENIKILDANKIIPEKKIFIKKTDLGESYSQFSDLFRYVALLNENNSLWIDCDTLCHSKKFNELKNRKYVFLQENQFFTGGVLKIKEGTYLKEMIRKTYDALKKEMTWQETASELITGCVKKNNLEKYSLTDKELFYPKSNSHIILDPKNTKEILKNIKEEDKIGSIFWNSYMKSKGFVMDRESVPTGSFIDYCYKKYL